MKTVAGFVLGVALAFGLNTAQAATVKVVAAENFYGDIAHQIGGLQVEVTSIMSNPDQDPHLFETSPAVVRQLADAQIVIFNGVDYDPWVQKLLAAAPRAGRIVISAAALTGKKPGDNPHLWYAPTTMPKVAQSLTDALVKTDPDHAADYKARLKSTLAALDRVSQRAAAMRAKWAGTPVTATEPVFGLMADAIGLAMRNQAFQLAMMNDTEPAAKDVAAFEDDLKQHKVKAMLYNKQVTEKLTQHLLDIAKKAKVPVVAVTETQPAGMSFEDWMLGELEALDKALSGTSS